MSSPISSTMSLPRLLPLPLPLQPSLPCPSSHSFTYLPLRIPPPHTLHVTLSLPPPRQTTPFRCSSPSSDPLPLNNDSEDQERELREVVMEILEQAGVSPEECVEIVGKAKNYAKMLRDEVRDLDELSMWDSWVREAGGIALPMSFKEKVKRIAQEKGDNGKIPYLESVGLSLSSAIHFARLLSNESLPFVIRKVKYVKEIFFSGTDDRLLAGKLARRMMFYLSISVDEDVQQTLSFFEKIEARRGGLDMLGSCDASFRHLIESFPRILLLPVESNLKPMVMFLEEIGVPRQYIGNVILLYPPLLFLDTGAIKAALQPFAKVGVAENNIGRTLVKYPWVLSRGIRKNYEEIVAFFTTEEVPKVSIDQAVRDWPLMLGSSIDKLKPMVEQFDALGIRTTRLGKVIRTSPQLLLRKPEEFQKVVSFVRDLGFDKEALAQVITRCPEIFAATTEDTLQKKVAFLTDLGISIQQLPRAVKKYPEILVYDVDRTVKPRLGYLIKSGVRARVIASMVTRFSPLLGYSIQEVLRPKLDFLVNTMGKSVKEVVEYPRYFSHSLEKKIKPRFFLLKSRNINCSVKDMLSKNDEEFATEYLGITERTLTSSR